MYQGNQTICFDNPPHILSHYAVVGKKEGEGPLRDLFDRIENDPYMGEDNWEKGESSFLKAAIEGALSKSETANADFIIAGDLLNQCTASGYGIRGMNCAFLGIYGACSTMAESLIVGSALVSGKSARRALCATSSHFCGAEKQFRLPLEYGGQRTPTAQWTVTGSGAVILGEDGGKVRITHATAGKITDMGVSDANNMGGAMAPAFIDTLEAHLAASGRSAGYYDAIFSGDLGFVGKDIAIELAHNDNIDLSRNYEDCGCLMFDSQTQDTHAGGSGCGCSASVLCSYILPRLESGKYKKVLFIATGALMSPVSSMQGESIPAIAHAVAFES
ncbi:MAG: stage V sporulation protein AD [Clostridia bacterium]|nr:stage V sporulation protein AD [Clostridia bacterium]